MAIPKNQTVNNEKKALLNQARRGREPKRIARYRRGKVTNTGAGLQPPRPDPNAGRIESEQAQFLGQINQLLFGKGMLQEQYQEAERDKGIASWEKASPEQRESYELAIKNGWIDSKESPYFRESVTKAYTRSLLTKVAFNAQTNYEKWEDKTNPDSGAIDKFFEGEEDKFAINIDGIPDDILDTEFHEQWQLIKRNISQNHAKFLNSEFRQKAEDSLEQEMVSYIFENEQAIFGAYRLNPNTRLKELLANEYHNEHDFRDVRNFIQTIKQDGKLSHREVRELREKAFTKGGIHQWFYEGITGNTDLAIAVDEGGNPQPNFISPKLTKEIVPFIASPKWYPSLEDQQMAVMRLIDLNENGTMDNLKGTKMYHTGVVEGRRKTSSKDVTIGNWDEYEHKLSSFNNIVAFSDPTDKPESKQSVLVENWTNVSPKNIKKRVEENEKSIHLSSIMNDGDGAYKVLPKFLETADDLKRGYETPVREWTAKFRKQPLNKQRELFIGFLDKYYDKKNANSVSKIWDYSDKATPKQKKEGSINKQFLGNWGNAKFDLTLFKHYVENKQG